MESCSVREDCFACVICDSWLVLITELSSFYIKTEHIPKVTLFTVKIVAES